MANKTLTIYGLLTHKYLFKQIKTNPVTEYNAFDDANRHVGYVQLNRGIITVRYPDCHGVMILQSRFHDKRSMNRFLDPEEEAWWLSRAADAITNRIKRETAGH